MSPSKNKFGAKSCWYDPIQGFTTLEKINENQEFFSSQLELEVYRELLLVPGIVIERQVKVPLKAPRDFFPALYWKCDFQITSTLCSKIDFLIEAKGMPTREFKHQMMMLEDFSDSLFRKLIIVSTKSLKLSYLELRPSQLQPFLITLMRSK